MASLVSGLWTESVGSLKILQHSYLAPQAQFTAEQIPDLSGRVMLVTGGNAGIGIEIVKELLKHNAKVYLAARNRDTAHAVIDNLKQETGKEAIYIPLDLTDFQSIRKAAEDFLAKEEALHVLFNNAGVMCAPDKVTPDGYDMQFGTNVLGTFLFTQLLLPALLRGVASSPDKHARIVSTASAYSYIGQMRFDTFKDGPARRKRNMEELYSQSKLGAILVAFELARRYGDQGIVSVALHPGILRTDMMTTAKGLRYRLLDPILRPPSMGALTPLYAGTAPDPVRLNGKWLVPWAREMQCWNKAAYDADLAKNLWEWLEEELKGR